MKYELHRGSESDNTAKVILIVVSLAVGFVIGLFLGVRAVEQYLVYQPIQNATEWTTTFFDAKTLPVINNYNEQKTAHISKLEPKVSDAYYQWGSNPQVVGLNK